MEDYLIGKIDEQLKSINSKQIRKFQNIKILDRTQSSISKKHPKNGDLVSVHYRGTLLNGKEFDNSWKKKKPFEFRVGQGQVIQGWDRVIKKMKIGETIKVYIPSELAYGTKSMGNIIPANSDLIFTIKLLEINNR